MDTPIFSAMCSSRNDATRWEDVLLPRRVQHAQARSFLKALRFLSNHCFGSDKPHDAHSCDMRLCPATCDLCRRLCVQPHLHGLTTGSSHICGSVLTPIKVLFKLRVRTNREIHPCSALCSAQGICQIDTAPLSIEATFTGKHETFQYTKVTSIAT
jgi:hypothetical protein